MSSYINSVPEELQCLYPKKMSIWDMRPGGICRDMAHLLNEEGRAIVTPTKVGYIVMTTDRDGLEKKFVMKRRPKKKPGVILCADIKQLCMLADLDAKIKELYETCWKKDILLGCILPWRTRALEKYVPHDGSADMVQDARGTSCFVIKYGDPSERVAEYLWHTYGKLAFASSANPSGKGNRGQLKYVGDRIIEMTDHLVFADGYVERQQPGKSVETRWEQGVMVSFVDERGALSHELPMIIRHGLALEKIKRELQAVYGNFRDCHGAYH